MHLCVCCLNLGLYLVSCPTPTTLGRRVQHCWRQHAVVVERGNSNVYPGEWAIVNEMEWGGWEGRNCLSCKWRVWMGFLTLTHRLRSHDVILISPPHPLGFAGDAPPVFPFLFHIYCGIWQSDYLLLHVASLTVSLFFCIFLHFIDFQGGKKSR